MFWTHVREFLAFLRIECGLAANTLMAYERDLVDLGTHLGHQGGGGNDQSTLGAGDLDLQNVTPADLAVHLRWLRTERNLASSSICRHLATIRMFFRFLTANGRISENPTAILERPSTWTRLPAGLTPVQIRRLLESPRHDQGVLYLRDRAILELMYAAGLRATETVTLSVRDYHETLGVINVLGKGQHERIVPIGRPAAEAVAEYLAELRPLLVDRNPDGDCERLLLSHTGRPLERIAIWQIVRRHSRSAGLDDVHPHQLRHSFATHLVNGGANLREVQELLGHADIRSTQTYTHVDAHRLREIHRQYHPRS